MCGGHQERPDGEIGEADLHSSVAGVAVAEQAVEAESKESDRHSELKCCRAEDGLSQAGQRHHQADGQSVASGNRP